jgi:MarR family transcriptional regulator, organic hydroperoxide resistance regulator
MMSQSENQLGFLLFLVSRAHHNRASQFFERFGLYRGQPPVLFELGEHDGSTQSELAEKLEVTPATMSNMLQRLETAGFVKRQRDPADARISRVFLTPAGKEAVVHAADSADDLEEIAFSGFTPLERKQIKDFLERIHANLTLDLPSENGI